MDLLGSILNAMDKPPAANEKQKEAIKKQNEHVEKMRNHQKDDLNRFRKYAEERLDRLGRDPTRTFMQFQPLDKMYRTVVHDIAEVAGLTAMSFGQDGVDRYIVVYKREKPPTEDEITARREGEEWNEAKAKEYKQNRKHQRLVEEDKAKVSEVVLPTSNYKDKYVHLIGQDAALEAAKKTQSNKSYGFVPSENKKDVRSIEQTMADIQAKKRLKTTHTCRAIEDIIANNTAASLKQSLILQTAVGESSASTSIVAEVPSIPVALTSDSPVTMTTADSSENTTKDV